MDAIEPSHRRGVQFGLATLLLATLLAAVAFFCLRAIRNEYFYSGGAGFVAVALACGVGAVRHARRIVAASVFAGALCGMLSILVVTHTVKATDGLWVATQDKSIHVEASPGQVRLVYAGAAAAGFVGGAMVGLLCGMVAQRLRGGRLTHATGSNMPANQLTTSARSRGVESPLQNQRRWLQFRLGTLLAVVTIAAAGLYWPFRAYQANRARDAYDEARYMWEWDGVSSQQLCEDSLTLLRAKTAVPFADREQAAFDHFDRIEGIWLKSYGPTSDWRMGIKNEKDYARAEARMRKIKAYYEDAARKAGLDLAELGYWRPTPH